MSRLYNTIKNIFKGGKQKTTGKTVNPFERKKMRSNRDAVMGGLKVDLAKLKGSAKKLQTTAEDVKAAIRDRARVKKMGGGMMGRRMGYSRGTPKPKTNVQKIKEAFATKSGLKKIDPKKQKGLAKLKKARPDVVRKMGYFKRGGRSK